MSIRKRRTNRGDVYDVRYRGFDGKERCKTLDTMRQARDFEAEQRTAMRKGVWTDPKAGRVTLADWSAQWLASQPGASARTLAIYSDNVRLHLLPDVLDGEGKKVFDGLGVVELGKLTTAQVAAWVSAMGHKPKRARKVKSKGDEKAARATLAPASIHQACRVLRQCLEAAVTAGHIGRNPMDGVKRPRVEFRGMRYLTADEVESVADATDERYRALVLVAAYGGLRLGEMRALRWENVDLMARTIRVVEQADDGRGRGATKPPKTAAGRRSVSLPRFVVAELIKHGRRQHQTDETRCNSGEAERPMLRLVADGAEGEGNDETPTWTGLVFQAPGGGPIDQNHLRNRVWIPAVKAAGIGPMRFHDLRHTCASLAIAAGADVKALQAMLGHASAAMTLDRYGHLMPGQAEAVADRFDALHEARAAKRSKVG